MISNRVELMIEMIFSDEDEAEKNFDKLVPKYHSELYVLYNILNNSDVLHNCELKMADSSADTLCLDIELSKNHRATILEYIKDNPDILKPFNHVEAVHITTEKTLHGLYISFG